MGTPEVASLVIRTAHWRVSMPYSATLDWVKAHPPRGLVQSGSAESGGPGGSEAGYGYSDRPGTAWESADLDIGVSPDGHGSAIRADAVVVWLDPHPLHDRTVGRRLHVTISGGCLADDRGVVGVRNDGQDLRQRLLPAGPPSAGLICRYEGLNGTRFALLTATRLDGSQAASVADAVARLRLSHTDGGVTNCPMDDASAVVVVLAYPGSDDVDLWLPLTGCSYVGNGFILAGGGALSELIGRYG